MEPRILARSPAEEQACSPGVVDPGEAIGEQKASPHEAPSDQGEDQGPGALLLLSLTDARRERRGDSILVPFLASPPSEPPARLWPQILCCSRRGSEVQEKVLGAQLVLSLADESPSIISPDMGQLQDS